MNEIKITTELCAEDRARLDKLLEALAGIPAAINTAGTPYPAACETVDHKDFVEVKEPEAPEAVETEPTPAPVAEVAEPQHTRAELQQKIANLVSKGKREEARETVHKYAPKVSNVPDDKLDELWDLLSELEG